MIPRGAGTDQIARLLTERGVIAGPIPFRVGSRLDGTWRELKAGEYAFPAAVSPRAAARLIASGRTVVRRLTLPEGFTTRQAIALLESAEGLHGQIGSVPGEGELLPDTYFYSWGDSRERMLERQRRAMRETLAELWANRAPNLPLATPAQAVILASIVEKETAVPDERPRIAAVFINRLRRGMRLQADPTVIYGLTNGQGPLDRALTRADLETPHPWNTYVISGLPPTPIANPGRAALAAVLNPLQTDELYFVADGSGRHLFARTLAEHNRNVQLFRETERQRTPDPK
ncbi:MAG TPA: endolytic transglycosylase MltG [Alphaproteobacteria bacterium]